MYVCITFYELLSCDVDYDTFIAKENYLKDYKPIVDDITSLRV